VCKYKFKRVSDTKTNFILSDLLKLIDKQGKTRLCMIAILKIDLNTALS